MQKLKKVLLVLCLLLFVFSLTGCGKSESKKIKLGISAFVGWFPYYIAAGEDYFKKNGVDVELVWFPVYSDSLQAFNSGKLDLLCVALPDTPALYMKDGTPFKIIALNDYSNGGDGIVAKKHIQSLQDLKGKKVATEYATIEHFFLLKALETAGLTEADIQLVNMSVGDSAPAVISGAVDAAGLWEPALSIAKADSSNRLLFDSSRTPGLIQDTTIATEKLIKNNPAAVTAVINAYLDALDFYRKNPDQAIEYMRVPAEVDAPTMREVMSGGYVYGLKDMLNALNKNTKGFMYSPYSAHQAALFLQSVKMLDNVPDDIEYFRQMYDWSFVEAIAQTRPVTSGPDTRLKK
jgi:NitT/TauT family transport system substrate-binding protein